MNAAAPPSRCCTLSIPGRLALVSAAALLVCSLLLLSFATREYAVQARAELADRVERDLQFVVAPVTGQVVVGDYELLQKMLDEAARRTYVAEVSWGDAHGIVLRALREPAASVAPDWFVRWAGVDGIARSSAIEVGGRFYGRITLIGSPVALLNQVWDRALTMGELLLLTSGILVGLVLVVANRVLRPLAYLSAAARRFGAGDHAVRVAERGPPELAALAGAFNEMAGSLQRSLASLRDALAHNRLLATVVEQSNDAILTKDLDGHITSWNRGAERIFGYAASEVIGASVSILHPPGKRGDIDGVIDRVRSARPALFEAERIGKDGSIIAIASSVSPLHDEAGRHVGEISVIRDITAAKQAEQALFDARERARVTLDAIGEGVIRVDAEERVEYLNPAAERMTGWSAGSALGRPIREVFVVAPNDAEPGAGGVPDLTMRARDGTVRGIEQVSAPLRGQDGAQSGRVVVFRDVGESRRLARQLSWQASHDALTGLTNRHDFERRLHALVGDAGRAGKGHALLYVDLDQFKVVNDTCGHVAGDEMLRQVSTILQPCLRATDVLARLGGDEFGVLLEHCTLEQAETVAEKLRVALAEYRFAWENSTFAVRASIGVAAIDADSDNAAAVLAAADAACFSAKEGGRNRVQTYHCDDAELARRRVEMGWVSRIGDAISANRLRLWCQPIVPVAGSGCGPSHYEILVRLEDADGRMIPPMAFIPAAERYGLMPSVDRHLVALAFDAFAARLAEDEQSAPPHIAINLSGATLNDAGFLDFVREQFRRTALAPGRICFEITETAAIANLSRARSFMAQLKELGCMFSLDDFGSGFSSFAYLKNLPVDFLKIDGAFVKDMAKDPIDCAMVEAINQVGHVMGIRTIAEFVENDEIRIMLRTIGVDYAQGYGIGKPQPVEQAWGRSGARPRLRAVANG